MIALAFPAAAAGWLLLYSGFKGVDPRDEFVAAFRGGHASKKEMFTDGSSSAPIVGVTDGAQLAPQVPIKGGKRNGLKPIVLDELELAEKSYGLTLTSGYRPGSITSSGNKSLHGVGQAIDVSGPTPAMAMYAQAAAGRPGVYEVIYTPVGIWKASVGEWRKLDPESTLGEGHFDHVHVGVTA